MRTRRESIVKNEMRAMLKRENVQLLESVNTWEDAIHFAVQPLVDTGYVEARYIDGIIENARKYGPYFVICPDLALLHARPEQGVIKKQLAVTILRKGIRFKENGDPVRVLVTLAAEDADSHIDVMRCLASMFSNPRNIETLIQSDSADMVYDRFMGAADEA